MASDCLARVAIVLSRTSHPGNIGAAARAMKTMGLTDLRLVAPRHFPDPDATAMAAGAADLLANARVFDTLEGALRDVALSVGFSARARDRSHPAEALRAIVPELLAAASDATVALVFGNETSGLSNEELSRCQRLAAIPANPQYPSLNLAAAVQIACYEIATAAEVFAVVPGGAGSAATGEDLEGLFAHLEASARETGFLDPEKPGRFIEMMRRLFARSGLEREEVKVLRGFLRARDAKRR
jgi:tRNA/rRNA methyltransferase